MKSETFGWAVGPFGNDTERVFRADRSLLAGGVCVMPIFLLALVGSTVSMGLTWGAAPIGLFWLGWCGMGLWLIGFAVRYRLVLSSQAVMQLGLFRSRTLVPSRSVRVTWRQWPHPGRMILQTSQERLVIDLGSLDPAQCEDVIACLQAILPPSLFEDARWKAIPSFRYAAKKQDRQAQVSRWAEIPLLIVASLVFTILAVLFGAVGFYVPEAHVRGMVWTVSVLLFVGTPVFIALGIARLKRERPRAAAPPRGVEPHDPP